MNLLQILMYIQTLPEKLNKKCLLGLSVSKAV